MNDYPNNEQLNRIREWNSKDFSSLMAYVYEIWNIDYGSYWQKDRGREIYRLHTGGWSGNEDIITAMQDNFLFWSTYFYQYRRGGHYTFREMIMGRALRPTKESVEDG
jgi:hypothetical protein